MSDPKKPYASEPNSSLMGPGETRAIAEERSADDQNRTVFGIVSRSASRLLRDLREVTGLRGGQVTVSLPKEAWLDFLGAARDRCTHPGALQAFVRDSYIVPHACGPGYATRFPRSIDASVFVGNLGPGTVIVRCEAETLS